MPIPLTKKIGKSILQFLEDGKPHNLTEVTEHLAGIFNVTVDERQERTIKSESLKFDLRIRWVVSELRQALLLENLRLGVFRITQRGLGVLKEDPITIDSKFLKKFPEFNNWLEEKSDLDKIKYGKKKKQKIEKKIGLVSYIDVLGTKELWKNSKPEAIPKIWNKFTTEFHAMLKRTMKDKNVKLSFNSFSDTIIITVEYPDNIYLLTKFGSAVWNAIVRSIELGIPIRGCFSLGSFYHEGNFFIGEAITEAAEYYELPQWIGISASPSANLALERLSKQIPSTIYAYYHKCSIPLKNSIEQEAWAIKWPELYETKYINENDKNHPHIPDKINSQLEKTKDVSVALKWRNTKKFFDDVINNTPTTIDLKEM